MKSYVQAVLSGSFLEEQTMKLNRNKSLSTKRNHPRATRLFCDQKASLLSVILVSITFGSSSAVLAQEKVEKPLAAVTTLLGLKASDLQLKAVATPYQETPIVDDTSAEDFSGGRSTSGVSDVVGGLSVEDFQGTQNNLSYTHESTDGFINYLGNWYSPNWHLKDADVAVWAYHDQSGGDNYDLWSYNGTDYGIDAVLTAWHSGHGGMSSTNVFFAPMGADWGGRGWNAFSNQMSLGGNNYSYGDERLRYMFWDTCNSVMVSGGNDPYSTWGTRSKGVRMVFGYETTSIDSPKYGEYFWTNWGMGKTLTQAFLDASWNISTSQSPAVVAFGSDQNDATYRLDNERYLDWGAVGNNWGQWRWYFARTVASSLRSVPIELLSQKQGMVYQIIPKSNTDGEITEIARAFGINAEGANQAQERPFGVRALETEGARLMVEPNGNFELLIKAAASENTSDVQVSDDDLISRAQEIAEQSSFMRSHEFEVGLIRDLNENGGSGGHQDMPHVVEKTVVFDQLIDGLPFIDPKAGHLEITFDARTGQANQVRSTVQALEGSSRAAAVQVTTLSIEQARVAALKLFSKSEAQRGAQYLGIVPGSEAVGYHLIDGKVMPVFRAEIKDSNEQFGRPKLAIIPLVQID